MASKPAPAGGRLPAILVFHFAKGKPIGADELGKLFVSLARDYRRLTRCTLVVTKVEAGSLAVTDAAFAPGARGADPADRAAAMEAMLSLGRSLQGLLKQAQRAGAARSPNTGPGGQASLAQFLKALAKSGGEGRFELSSRREKIKARLTSADALAAKPRAKAQHPATVEKPPDLPMLVQRGDTRAVVNRFGPIEESEVEAALPLLMRAIRNVGLGFYLDMIANEMDVRGQHRIAWAMRADIRQHRDVGPPKRGDR